MGDWRDFPLPDGSYSDATRPWTQQDVVNYLPTFAEQSGTRSRIKYTPVPGLQSFARVGTGPHRGGRDVEGKCFIVSGNKLYQVLPSGVSTELGTIPGTGLVSMTHNQIANGNQLLIGTGSNSYIYNTVTSTLAATGIPLTSVDFLNQLFLGVDQARRFSRYSGLADGMAWNTLDNISAESSPDRIVGGKVSQGEWLQFGERTTEVWPNNPTQDTAFVRSVVIERGCINANTIQRLDNTVFFVDNNFIPCRMQGYQPVPIAPKAIVDELSRCDPAKLSAYTWEDRGYVVYYITAQDGRTWGYDVTSQKWHRRESFGLDRWRVNTLFKWNGEWYGGDYTNGNLYRLEWGHVFEACEVMPRRLRTGVLHNNGNRVFIHGFKLNMETGRAPSVCAPNISGALADTCDDADYSVTVPIAQGTAPYSDPLIVSGAAPTGTVLTMDGDGVNIAFSDATAGTYDFWITVKDATGAVSTPFLASITSHHFAITGSLPGATGGAAYTADLTLADGVAPYGTPVITGTLQASTTATVVGDTLTIAWPLTNAGITPTINISITDATGCTATRTYVVPVDSTCVDLRDPSLNAIHYLLLDNTDTDTSYAASGYDYSAWATGLCRFDSNTTDAVTVIPLLKKMWARHEVILSSTTGLRLQYEVDDLIGIWVNGVNLLDGYSPGGGVHYYDFNPADLTLGCNHFALTAKDTGAGRMYFNWKFIQT